MKRNPREIRWTVLYRRKHKKGTIEEQSKKRTRKTQKFNRAYAGATLDQIMQKRNQTSEVRKAQRDQAIRYVLIAVIMRAMWIILLFYLELPRRRQLQRRRPKSRQHQRYDLQRILNNELDTLLCRWHRKHSIQKLKFPKWWQRVELVDQELDARNGHVVFKI